MRSKVVPIAFLAIVGVIVLGSFVFNQDGENEPAPAESNLKPLQGFTFDEAPAAETSENNLQSEGSIGIPVEPFEERNVALLDADESASLQARVDEFRKLFAAGESCQYFKLLVEMDKSSIAETFAKQPTGHSAEISDTELLTRLYGQGAFAALPASNPMLPTKSEEFLMALRNSGLLLGTNIREVDFASGEKQFRKIASREPDNGAPLFFLIDVLAAQKKDASPVMEQLFGRREFETHWEEVLRSVVRQAEGSPDHFLIGSLLATTLPSPNFMAPLSRIKSWIQNGDPDLAKRALAWAEHVAKLTRRSGVGLERETYVNKQIAYSVFMDIANEARKKLKLPIVEKPSLYSKSQWHALIEEGNSLYEDLLGHKMDYESSLSPAPCDRRTLDREYQKFLTRKWRSDQR